ncbi:hypothetical protein ACOME3_008208 [Neoechinorhynchus agilis]
MDQVVIGLTEGSFVLVHMYIQDNEDLIYVFLVDAPQPKPPLVKRRLTDRLMGMFQGRRDPIEPFTRFAEMAYNNHETGILCMNRTMIAMATSNEGNNILVQECWPSFTFKDNEALLPGSALSSLNCGQLEFRDVAVCNHRTGFLLAKDEAHLLYCISFCISEFQLYLLSICHLKVNAPTNDIVRMSVDGINRRLCLSSKQRIVVLSGSGYGVVSERSNLYQLVFGSLDDEGQLCTLEDRVGFVRISQLDDNPQKLTYVRKLNGREFLVEAFECHIQQDDASAYELMKTCGNEDDIRQLGQELSDHTELGTVDLDRISGCLYTLLLDHHRNISICEKMFFDVLFNESLITTIRNFDVECRDVVWTEDCEFVRCSRLMEFVNLLSIGFARRLANGVQSEEIRPCVIAIQRFLKGVARFRLVTPVDASLSSTLRSIFEFMYQFVRMNNENGFCAEEVLDMSVTLMEEYSWICRNAVSDGDVESSISKVNSGLCQVLWKCGYFAKNTDAIKLCLRYHAYQALVSICHQVKFHRRLVGLCGVDKSISIGVLTAILEQEDDEFWGSMLPHLAAPLNKPTDERDVCGREKIVDGLLKYGHHRVLLHIHSQRHEYDKAVESLTKIENGNANRLAALYRLLQKSMGDDLQCTETSKDVGTY